MLKSIVNRLSSIVTAIVIFLFTINYLPLTNPALAQTGPRPDSNGNCPAGYSLDVDINKCSRTSPENNSGSSGSNNSGLGKITAPAGTVPNVGANPSVFVANLVQASVLLLITASFIIALIWTIIGGIRFILANGDEKTIASAWSQIYWSLIGMVVVLGAFAIIKLVETFFDVTIISDFKLPKV